MQLDMANFTLQMARPDIIACSVDLERKKFADFLSIQAGKTFLLSCLYIFTFQFCFIVDGLQYTRNWLLKYVNSDQPVAEDVEYELFVRGVLKRAFVQACVDLIDWPANTPYPEVCTKILVLKLPGGVASLKNNRVSREINAGNAAFYFYASIF